jgi:hypothetical protein
MLQDVLGAIPFTVIHQTALLDSIVFKWLWLITACPSASATLYNVAEIEGATYSAPPEGWNIYGDGAGPWTVSMTFAEVAIDIATTYHTATIVRIPNYVQRG